MPALMLVISSICWSSPGDIDRLLDAIEVVESRGNIHAVGDGGRSHGPYQIQKAYAEDALRVSLTRQEFLAKTHNRLTSRAIVIKYWKRYAPRHYAAGNLEALARIHNGGPTGNKKAATRGYWERVRKVLTKEVKHDTRRTKQNP